ncbi:MAG: hypothetical protein A2X13_14920 [Bacteroidetes bacterium GWC2_33_15]|nr:MAG: hypothetical protein A2X10_06985 [Bacteroidetes bacterium GWA2_33_15]OFX50162.1 MAG: hypothetical protein A2X13_14920 [Bacteroidetes bacterium GWC2_33_15]OFX65314.1 MAG: hypothetical protein A2X15_04495 [Bacteroidetes bacterium GWB2_32_14]OFX70541.1 MAG: hypothetical protein A2X14_04550 [Bacteroidetes bacterium GWD2_33_33]HAN19585.1 twin-arginine translocase TatA/TatE family subunit [Bacteroidales bacterium]
MIYPFLFISGSEIFIVFLVILLLFGADKIPEIAKALGKGAREFKKAADEIKKEINSQGSDLKNDLKDIKKDIDKTKNDILG